MSESLQTVQLSQDDTSLSIRFAREVSTNPKAPVAAYFLSADSGPFAGLEWKGQVFRDQNDKGGAYSVSVPGGKNFGGILAAKLETAEVNGRTIAISGSYDEGGLRKMQRWSDVVKTAFYAFLTDPSHNSVQRISL